MWDDGDVRVLAATCDEAHRHGALAGIELSHTGAHGENSESRLAASAPSQIASDFAPGLVPRAMTKRDIRRVQADWVRAAEQSRRRGLRHRLRLRRAHLPARPVPVARLQPPHRRVRRLARATARASGWRRSSRCATAVGDDCAIACRVAVDRMGALGVDIEEGLEFVRMADHLVDLWDVNVGSIAEWSQDSGPSRFFAEGWQLDSTGARARGDHQADRGRRPPHRPRSDGRDRAQRRLGSDRRRPALDRRPVPAGARSTRAASTRSASASAATSASPRPIRAATSAARRTRRPARSTAAAGTPSASRRCAPASTRSWSAAGRPAWSAR